MLTKKTKRNKSNSKLKSHPLKEKKNFSKNKEKQLKKSISKISDFILDYNNLKLVKKDEMVEKYNKKKIIFLLNELHKKFISNWENIFNNKNLNVKNKINKLSIIIDQYDADPKYIFKYLNLIKKEKNFEDEYKTFMVYLNYEDRLKMNNDIINNKKNYNTNFINLLNNEKSYETLKKIILYNYFLNQIK